ERPWWLTICSFLASQDRVKGAGGSAVVCLAAGAARARRGPGGPKAVGRFFRKLCRIKTPKRPTVVSNSRSRANQRNVPQLFTKRRKGEEEIGGFGGDGDAWSARVRRRYRLGGRGRPGQLVQLQSIRVRNDRDRGQRGQVRAHCPGR